MSKLVLSSKKILLACVLASGCLVFMPAHAQTPANKTTWTLQECVDYAINNNLQVKQAALDVELSKVNLEQARSNVLPTLNGSSSYSFNFGLNNDPTTGILVNQNSRSNSFSLSSNVPLFSGFQLRNTIKQSQYNYEAAQADTEKSRNDLILNIVSSYMQVILSDELLQTAQLQMASTRQLAERTQKLFNAGSVAESNVFEINSQLASDEVNIVNAQNQKDLAEVTLIQLLNLPSIPDFEVVRPEIPEPKAEEIGFNPDAVYETAQQNLPEIKGADIRVKSALAGIDISRGALLPQLSLGGSLSTNYFNLQRVRVTGLGEEVTVTDRVGYVNGDVNQPVINTYKVKPPITEDYTYFSQLKDNRGEGVYISLSIPIFNGFRARNGVQRAVIGHKNAVLNTEIVRNQLYQTIQQSYADAVAAQKRYDATKRQLAALELTYRNAEIRFNNGVLNSTDFNVARNNFTRAQSDLIQAKYQFTFRLKVLDFYQGKPISL
jgi:outer membrane protein